MNHPTLSYYRPPEPPSMTWAVEHAQIDELVKVCTALDWDYGRIFRRATELGIDLNRLEAALRVMRAKNEHE